MYCRYLRLLIILVCILLLVKSDEGFKNTKENAYYLDPEENAYYLDPEENAYYLDPEENYYI